MKSLHLTTAILFSIIVRIGGQNEISCGQRLVDLTPRMTYAASAQHWPWHAVIYHRRVNDSIQEYRCGGTVITAGHCVHNQYVPVEWNRVSVSLGRPSLSASK